MLNLKSTPAPANAPSIVKRALEQLYRQPFGTAVPWPTATSAIEAERHHPVYELGLDTLAGGAGMAQARRSGSRYLLSQDGGLLAALEIATDAQGVSASGIRSVNEGPMVAATAQALERAAAWSGTAPSVYCLVRIAELRVCALQIKPDDEKYATYFWVMEPAPPGLKTALPYGEAELLATLRHMAQANLRQR